MIFKTMAQYPTNLIDSGMEELPITQQPISVITNIYTEMPVAVMGGVVPTVATTRGCHSPPPPYQSLQSQIGFKSNIVQPLQNYNDNDQSRQNSQQFHMQSQRKQSRAKQSEVEDIEWAKMAYTIANQFNPNAFNHSVIQELTGAPVMPFPPREGIPLGLEILADVDRVLVKQSKRNSKFLSLYETANRYNVLNSKGERIYFAGESTDIDALCCKGPHRPFQITIVDFSGRTVLFVERVCDCCLYTSNCWICCCCWLGTIGGKASVKLPDGTLLGEVVHKFGCYRPKLEIVDATGNILMCISGRNCGDCCLCKDGMEKCCFCSAEYQISLVNGTPLGIINKKWGGLSNLITDSDNFGASFPVDLDVKWKALIFGAVFLLDFMYYEQKSQD